MLTRWNPLQDFVTFDRLFNQLWNGGNRYWPDTLSTGPAMNVQETDDAFIFQVKCPASALTRSISTSRMGYCT